MALAIGLATVSVVVGLRGDTTSALEPVRSIPLPGVTGRFDHFAVDLKGRRLFVAALGNNTVEVIDLAGGKRLESISGLGKPTGVVFLPDLEKLFVACGDDGALRVFDGRSLHPVKTLTALDDADNMRFDTKAGLIYLGFGAGALAVVRPATAEKIGDIPLAGHPESFQLEKAGSRIYVNVPDARQVAVVDREKKAVLATWPMEEFKANFPMALDEPDHLLFIGCREPARLVVLDTKTGQKVTDISISGDIDDLFFDAARHRLYASCGEGYIDVISQTSAVTYARSERIPTSPGARTAYFSPELDQLYVAVPDRGLQKAEIRVYDVR
jgi:YVTN family beta-propeller protein